MAESPEFDLVSQPWIAVVDADGRSTEVSLAGLFDRAASLRVFSGDLPTQDVAILRLCLAILQRALDRFAPETPEDLPDQVDWLREHWDGVAVPAVLDYLGRYRDRFDLFHETQPFFQVAGIHTAKGAVWGLKKIIADIPDGAQYLASRSIANTQVISAPEAARWIVHLQAYDPAGIKAGVIGHPRLNQGKVYAPKGMAIGWVGQLGLVHLVTGNLRDTLLANLWATLLDGDDRARDLPPWERPVQDLDPSPDLSSRPAGPVDLYTWQPRRVRLFGDSDAVTGVLVTYGDRFIAQERQGVLRQEPMTRWRYSNPQSAEYKMAIQMPSPQQPGVALWRGLAVVLPADVQRSEDQDAPTELANHAARIRRCAVFSDGVIRFRAVSVEYGTNNSVFDAIVEDGLDLPSLILAPDERELRDIALNGVEAASEAVRALAAFARSLAEAAGGSEVVGPGDRAREAGFDALDLPYRNWLRNELVDNGDEPLVAEARWQETAWRVLDDIAQDLVTSVPDKAWLGFGATGRRVDVGLAYERFKSRLNAALPRAFAAENDQVPDESQFQKEAQ